LRSLLQYEFFKFHWQLPYLTVFFQVMLRDNNKTIGQLQEELLELVIDEERAKYVFIVCGDAGVMIMLIHVTLFVDNLYILEK
jgi:hypothetical protein